MHGFDDWALTLASKNAESLGIEDRVTFAKSDLLASVDGVFDAIVANLPYVVSAEIEGLEPEVSDHEPRLALDGGPDGLDLVRRLAAQAPGHLRPGGLLALEIGQGQGEAIRGLACAAGLRESGSASDLAGIERCLLFWA